MRYHTDIDPVLVAALAAKSGQGGGGTGGTTNYNQLTNRPQINGNTLEGNLTPEDLGLQPGNLVVTLTQSGESITADKSYADINQSYTDGKDIYAVIEGNIVPLYGKAGATYIFQSVLGVQVTDFEVNSENEWSVETINIIANSTRPGGIIADEKTDDDTVEVHVDSKTGKAYVNASQDTPTTTPPIINTASGNPITLTDSSDNLFQGFEMDGKTEQVTTTGAQLLDTNQLTIGGINGGSGENYNTQSGIRTDAYIPVDAKCTYTLSGYSPYNFANGIVYDESKTKIGFLNSNIKIPEGGKYIRLSFSKNDQSNFTDDELEALKTTIMLNYGSAALPWEPYTGGSPSPSPDYPQPIINGGTYDEEAEKWEYEVGVGGEQLFDVGSYPFTDNQYIDLNTGLTGTNSSYKATIDFIPFSGYDGTTINLNHVPGGSNPGMAFYSSNTQESYISGGKGNAITVPGNTKYMRFTVNIGIPDDDVMINQGSTALPYESYKHQSITLTADRPLTKWDKLEKRNGQWGWVYKSNTHKFNGNTDEEWYRESDYVVSGLLRDEIAKDKEVYCDEFTDARKNSTTSPYISVSKSGSVVVKYTQYTNGDISAWNEYVTSNPFVIWYETAEETFTPLTTEESAALDALVSYYPTTVISNQQGLNMTVDYIADTKAYIDNKFAELQQSLANTNAQLLGGN